MVLPAHVTIGHTDMYHLPDLAQRMPGGGAGIKVDIVEQRTARLVRPTHHHPAVTVRRVNHVPETGSRVDYFSGRLREECCCGGHVRSLRASLSKQTENHVDRPAPLDASLNHRRSAPGEKSRGRFFVSGVGTVRRKPSGKDCSPSAEAALILATPIVRSLWRTSGCGR